MKKFVVLSLLIALAAAVPPPAAADFAERFSLCVNPTGLFALGGSYSDTNKLNDVLNIGVGLDVRGRFKLSSNLYLLVGGGYYWLPVKSQYRPFAYREKLPAMVLPMISAEWMCYLKSGYMVEPYLKLGGFFSPWRFVANGLGGGTWPALANPTEKFSDNSWGLTSAFGVEVYVWRKISVFGEVKYYYLFSRNPGKFGTDDFSEQDFLGINLGFIFYFK